MTSQDLCELQVSADVKSLTPNQKKKRRQKLAKLGARQKVKPAAHVDPGANTVAKTSRRETQAGASEAGSLVSSSKLAAAGSEASTTAFARFASSCTSNRTQATVAAADLMSEVSTGLEPASVTSHASNRFNTAQIPSSPSGNVKAFQIQAACNAKPSGRLPDDGCTSNTCSEFLPILGPPAALVCRRDMSSTALAVQASLGLSPPDLSAALPPTTDAQEAQPQVKRQKRVFLHGNYNRYYGYRLGAALEEDPRVQVRY